MIKDFSHDYPFSFLHHCVYEVTELERLKLSKITSSVQTILRNKRVTRQSLFPTVTKQRFSNAYKNLFTANLVRGCCFGDDVAIDLVVGKFSCQLHLAMTNVDEWVRSPQMVCRKTRLDFVGCILRCMKFERMRIATQFATLSKMTHKFHIGALSAPYTFTARLI
jgi:hypothetical protein